MSLKKLGTLFLVATPIGNLEDVSFRALSTLKSVDSIYCEDTRRTSIFLKHFEIKTKNKVLSFHDHSSFRVIAQIGKLLTTGHDVAYITDGGMPVVSDPGFVLVRMAKDLGVDVTVIPGPSAAVMVYAASGLGSPKYLFHGFFPRVKGEIQKVLDLIGEMPMVHIFYEAPSRVQAAVDVLKRNFPNHQTVLARELTKLHEEFVRGSTKEVFEELHSRTEAGKKLRGECVIAILGGPLKTKNKDADASTGAVGSAEEQQELTPEQKEEISQLVGSGVSSKDAAKQLSKKFRLPRRIIYEFIIRDLT